MDYRIDFSAAEGVGIVGLMTALVARSDRIEHNDGQFTIDRSAILRTAPDGGPAVHSSGMTDDALFHLLDSYFEFDTAADAGALVTVLGTARLTIIAITAEFGATPLGFVVRADEILSSPQVFASAWPNLTGKGDADEEFEQEAGKTVSPQNPQDAMIFLPLLPVPDEDADIVSFLIFGATPKSVMEDLVAASTYVAADPEFLTLDLAQSGGALDVVSFTTSDGPAVELRLPLSQAGISDAIGLLAQNANALPDARVFYVTEIRDDEEMFIIQNIESDGSLGEPRRVTLN